MASEPTVKWVVTFWNIHEADIIKTYTGTSSEVGKFTKSYKRKWRFKFVSIETLDQWYEGHIHGR